MPYEVPGDFLDRIKASLERVWTRRTWEHTDADWEAFYKAALAEPCFEIGLSVVCTLQRARTGGISPEVTAFKKYGNLFQQPEQALDLLAMRADELVPVLGAEIEFNQSRRTVSESEAAVTSKIWGEPAPREGYLTAILYDLGRLLLVNPPFMVLVTSPPEKEGFEPTKTCVSSMYSRAARHRNMGKLLLVADLRKEQCFETFHS